MRATLFLAIICVGLAGVVVASAPPNAPVVEQSLGADELVQIGAHLSDLRRYDEAIDAFSQALELEPQNGEALANRSIAYASTNRLEQATADLDTAQWLLGDSAIVHRARALIAMRRSDDTMAIAELTKSLAGDPANPFALYYRAWLFQKAHREKDALADADAYIEAHPRSAEAYALRGELLVAQQKRSLALQQADELLAKFGDQAEPLTAAATIYDELGQREQAIAAISKAIELQPDSFLYLLLRSKYRRWDDFESRRADLKSALELNPGNLDIVTDLALIDFKQRRWSDAAAGFSTILKTEPKDFGVLAYRAMTYLQSNQPGLAARDYNAALNVASGPDDFSKICWIFANEGMALDWAVDTCNRAIAEKSDESAYLANRGLVELRLGRLTEALHDYDRAIAADARRAQSYYGRAVVKLRMGDPKGAEQDRNRAIAIAPQIVEKFRQFGLDDFHYG